MLSRHYQRKFLKHLDKNLNWADRLKFRDELLKGISYISLIPFKLRIKISSKPVTANHKWSKLGKLYLSLAYRMMIKSDTAHADYKHLETFNEKIANKFCDRIYKSSRNFTKGGNK